MSKTTCTKHLTEGEVADLLSISRWTLRQWRLQNKGPICRKIGSNVRYPIPDLNQWLDDQPQLGSTV